MFNDVLMDRAKAYIDDSLPTCSNEELDTLCKISSSSRSKAFSLFNSVMLMLQSAKKDIQISCVRTKKDWLDLGCSISENAKSMMIYSPLRKQVEELDESGDVIFNEKIIGYKKAFLYDISQLNNNFREIGSDGFNWDVAKEKLRASFRINSSNLPYLTFKNFFQRNASTQEAEVAARICTYAVGETVNEQISFNASSLKDGMRLAAALLRTLKAENREAIA